MRQFLRIPGPPIPKARPRTQKPGAIARRPYTPAKTRKFEELVRTCAVLSGIVPIEGAVELVVVARWTWPKSARRKRTKLPEAFKSTGADADNVTKAIQDALNGIAFGDDRQVARLIVEKRHAAEGRDAETLVWISSLEGRDPIHFEEP